MSTLPVSNEILHTLHRIHIQLHDLNDRLARGPRKIKAAQARMDELKTAADAAMHDLVALKVATDGKQAQLDKNIMNIQKRKEQLMESKDNREYTLLKNQIAADETANGVFEDEILEALERIDSLKEKAEAAKKEYEKGIQNYEKVVQEVNAQHDNILEEITRLQEEQKATETLLSPEYGEQYARIFRSKGFDTLAMLEGTHCKGCNTTVPINRISEILKEKPVFCSACGRLLYLPEDFRLR
ncbi:MAG: hypothetical protein Q4C96_06690 [Planctomycetia bacterium]|nr:hypothetical protein [Planctomycetia bacterium]